MSGTHFQRRDPAFQVAGTVKTDGGNVVGVTLLADSVAEATRKAGNLTIRDQQWSSVGMDGSLLSVPTNMVPVHAKGALSGFR